VWALLLACTAPVDSGEAPDSTGETADTQETAPPCTHALYTPADADPIDVSGELLSGDALVLDRDGVLEVCPGTWFVQLHVTAQVQVLGFEGTVLSGGESQTVITVVGGALDLRHVRIERGAARGAGNAAAGGAISCSDGGHVTVTDSVLADNAAYDGGALFGKGGCHFDLIDTELMDNVADDDGGAFRLESASATLQGVTVSGSQAKDGGAAILVESALVVRDSVFRDNEATDTQGGAILAYDGSIELVDSVFSDNRANEYGGALSLFGDATLSGVQVSGNRSGRGGGVSLYVERGALSCADCAFSDNDPDDVLLQPGVGYDLEGQGDFVCDAEGCR
jgi:hypothetical protein